MSEKMKEGLPPLLCEEPKILILGTFPGETSLETGEYYSDSRNAFWDIIATLNNGPIQAGDRKNVLMKFHIALWDIFKEVVQKGSANKNIECGRYNDVFKFLSKYSTIKKVVYNGKSDKWMKDFKEKHHDEIRSAEERGVSFHPLSYTTNRWGKIDDIKKEWLEILSKK